MKCIICGKQTLLYLLWADGRGAAGSCAAHKKDVRRRILKNKHAEIVGWRRLRRKGG